MRRLVFTNEVDGDDDSDAQRLNFLPDVSFLFDVERVAEGFVFVVARAFHRVAEFFFKNSFTTFERADLLLENPVALFALALHSLCHFIERGDGVCFLGVRDNRARVAVYHERCVAAGAKDCPTRLFHSFHLQHLS